MRWSALLGGGGGRGSRLRCGNKRYIAPDVYRNEGCRGGRGAGWLAVEGAGVRGASRAECGVVVCESVNGRRWRDADGVRRHSGAV